MALPSISASIMGASLQSWIDSKELSESYFGLSRGLTATAGASLPELSYSLISVFIFSISLMRFEILSVDVGRVLGSIFGILMAGISERSWSSSSSSRTRFYLPFTYLL